VKKIREGAKKPHVKIFLFFSSSLTVNSITLRVLFSNGVELGEMEGVGASWSFMDGGSWRGDLSLFLFFCFSYPQQLFLFLFFSL